MFIDLRAGLSELASPVIFDPRVEHYFCDHRGQTVSVWNVRGFAALARFHRALPEQQRRAAKPSVVISLLTQDLRRLLTFGLAKECIEQAYPPVNDSLDEGVEWLEAEFSPALMSIGTVRDAFDLLKTSSLYASSAQEWADHGCRSTSSGKEQRRSATHQPHRFRPKHCLRSVGKSTLSTQVPMTGL